MTLLSTNSLRDPGPLSEAVAGRPSLHRQTVERVMAQMKHLPPYPGPHWSPGPRRGPVRRDAAAEAFFKATGAKRSRSEEGPRYHVSTGAIELPRDDDFAGETEHARTLLYYKVLFHELIHWTGHATRLNRPKPPATVPTRYRDCEWHREELIAEFGAVFLMSDLGLIVTPIPYSVRMIDHHHSCLNIALHELRQNPAELPEGFEFCSEAYSLEAAIRLACEAVDFLHEMVAPA